MNPTEYAAKKLAAIDLNPDPTPKRKTGATGPRTEEGKRRSSINSRRHGLSGRTVVLPGEDMDLYLSQSKEVVESLNPETPVEYELAQTVADGYWRMKRLRTVEEGLFAWGNYEEAVSFDAANPDIHAAFTAAKAFRTNSNAFVNLSIYEQRIQRGIERALKQLREIQAERRALQAEALKEALRLRELDRMLEKAGAKPTYQVGPATQNRPGPVPRQPVRLFERRTRPPARPPRPPRSRPSRRKSRLPLSGVPQTGRLNRPEIPRKPGARDCRHHNCARPVTFGV